MKCSIEGCNKDSWARGWCSMHYRRWRVNGSPELVLKGPEGPAWNFRGRFEGCWEWTGDVFNRGQRNREYGRVWFEGKARLAHVLAWEAINGTTPEGFELCHRCDNPKCWRPDHLFLGTHQENIQDASNKGRMARKLSEDDVTQILKLVASGESIRSVGRQFNVTHEAIRKVIRRPKRLDVT